MAIARVTHTYNAPKKAVFAVLADVGNVCEISPGIQSSRLINDKTGKGAIRECDFGNGAGIHEEVTRFQQDKHIQLTGIKFWGAPMKKMVATFTFHRKGDQTVVVCDMDYDMKFGLLLNPIAKPMNRKAVKAMLAGVERKL